MSTWSKKGVNMTLTRSFS